MDKKTGCYWIAKRDCQARRDCDKETVYLYKAIAYPDTEALKLYEGTICPNCGKPIYIDEESFSLVKNTEE